MSEDLARLDATAQAELVRNGEASPLELVDAAIERIEASNGEINAVIHKLYDEGREAAAGDLPDGPFKGVPFLLKDLGAAFAGQPLHMGMQLLKDADFRSPVDTYLAMRFKRGRLRHDRQDEHPGARDPADDRAEGVRAESQPLGPRTLDRRIERWIGGRGRRGHGPGRPRQRRRRLDPHPGERVRPGGAQADPAAHLGGPDHRRQHVRPHGRAGGVAVGPRHGCDPRGGPRAGSGRSVRGPAALAPVHGGGRAPTRASCASGC